MAIDDLGDDVGQIGLRIDGVELAGFDQRGDDSPVLTAAVGAGEESIFSIQCDRTDRPFHDVAVDLDAAVIEEADQAIPARQGIADRLRELGLLANQAELGAKPGFEVVDDRPALLLPKIAPLIGAAATDLALNDIELGNVFERFAGDRRGAGRGELEEAAAHMGPAEGKLDVAT